MTDEVNSQINENNIKYLLKVSHVPSKQGFLMWKPAKLKYWFFSKTCHCFLEMSKFHAHCIFLLYQKIKIHHLF